MKRRIDPYFVMTLPATLFVIAIFVVPVAILLSEGFRHGGAWTLRGYAGFFADPLNLQVLLRTLRIGVLVTACAVILGYASALAVHSLPTRARRGVLLLTMVPLMVSPVARTYVWLVILARQGLLNAFLLQIGLISSPARFLFREGAIFVGLLQLLLPLMVLTLVSALENLPADMLAAARVLGANRLQLFWKVILPLTWEGMVVGATLVFTGSLTAYITPAILGGSKVLMLETQLYQYVTVVNDIASASIVALIIVVLGIVANFCLRQMSAGRIGR